MTVLDTGDAPRAEAGTSGPVVVAMTDAANRRGPVMQAIRR